MAWCSQLWEVRTGWGESVGEGSQDLTCPCTSESSQMMMKPAEDPDEELRFKQVLAVPVAQESERRPGRVGRAGPSPSERVPVFVHLSEKSCHFSSVGHREHGGGRLGLSPARGRPLCSRGEDVAEQDRCLAPGAGADPTAGTPRPRTSARSCRGGERPSGAQAQLSSVDACPQATETLASPLSCSGAGAC